MQIKKVDNTKKTEKKDAKGMPIQTGVKAGGRDGAVFVCG
ncbi:hypothetical protein APED_02975 [Acanthopleuribacter pedis]